MLDYPIRVDAAKKILRRVFDTIALLGRVALGKRIVPQVRVATLDANLGSLTLTTDVTPTLDPAIYNSLGCQTARRSYTWPPLHLSSRPSPCPRMLISR